MKTFEVVRHGKCIECGQVSIQFLGEVEAGAKEGAIEKAKATWLYEHFGQGGALRETETITEEDFLNADFKANEIK